MGYCEQFFRVAVASHEFVLTRSRVLFFLFYFNRLFATIVSYGIRAYTWHYYRVYVDIHALQISLLGGRIFFKGFRYHGENETILIQTGYLTWRYWLRTVRAAGIYCEDGGISGQEQSNGGPAQKASQLPCRIELTIQGLEWFIYNRSAAYESILEGFPHSKVPNNDEHGTSNEDEGEPDEHKQSSARVNVQGVNGSEPNGSSVPSESHTAQEKEPSAAEYAAKVLAQVLTSQSTPPSESRCTTDGTQIPKFFALLPIWFQCTKGAIVIGNENTKSILTATFDKGTGEADIKKAGPLDSYKQVFDFDFSHPIIQLKPNPDYKQSQLAAARTTVPVNEDLYDRRKRGLHWRYQRQKRRMWHSIRDLIPYFQGSVESFHPTMDNLGDRRSGSRTLSGLLSENRWIGLTRYLDEEDQDEHEGWNAVEYGRCSTILDSPSMHVTYYWDTPGTVPVEHGSPGSSVRRVFQDINGAEPPEWGLDMTLNGGNINYGPWADRERVCFQSILFPNLYRDSQPAMPLTSGQSRQSTKFKLNIIFTEDISLRVPARESSKDWLWKGRVDAVQGNAKLKNKDKSHPRDADPDKSSHGPDIRPFGWLLLQADGKSTIKYEMDMVASSKGYESRLDVFLQGSKMTSSINHGLMWQSGKQKISCDLPTPLEWNSLRTWNFDIESHDLDLFLLRDHIFLLTDMVTDWTSGPYPDYHVFVPFQYNVNFSLKNLRLFLNMNDSNIVNNPSDTDDNAFMVIKGDLQSNVDIPMTKYRPNYNTIGFDLTVTDGLIQLVTPLWNTQRTFMKNQSIGSLKSLKVNGNYTYNLATLPNLTDVLTLDIVGDSPRLQVYGFLIRYFLNIKENYFGESLHFKTLEEYQELSGADKLSTPKNGANPLRKVNDLDIIMHIRGDKPHVLLPASIYGNRDNLALNATFFDTDVRFTNYYMDIEVFFSPVEAALEKLEPDGSRTVSAPQLFIDGLRIYGHRLFGLPPNEPTYVCNWDFEIGEVAGECTPDFLRCAALSLKSVGFSFDDEENALPPLHPIILHDVTFLRASVHSINVWTLVDNAAFLISSSELRLDYNDWAGERFSDRLNLSIPDLVFAAVDQNSALRCRESADPAKTYAYFQTSLNVTMIERKYDFLACRALQQQHIRLHDQRSNRTPWLLRPRDQSISTDHQTRAKVNPIPMPVSSMPEPARDVYFPDLSSPGSSLSSYSDRANTMDSNFEETSARRVSPDLPSRRPYQRNKAPATKTLSSRWAVPHFRFNDVQLDTSLVPLLPPIDDFLGRHGDGFSDIGLDFEYEAEKTTQVYIFCDLGAGLKGYCAPEAIFAFSSLLESFLPSHPIDIIDDLQASVISDILGHEKRLSMPKKTTDISLRIPVCRVKLIHRSASIDTIDFQDEYYVDVHRIQTLFRQQTETKQETVAPIPLGIIVHTAIDSISLSVKGEKLDELDQKGFFHTKLEDITFWSTSQDLTQSRLHLQTFEAVTSNDSVESLALLTERTRELVGYITDIFTRVFADQEKRLQSLIYSLTKFGSQSPDPLFLTRPSYVLRAASEHLRLHDSWKIVSRFRNIYNSLPKAQKATTIAECIDSTNACPPDGRSFVLSNFDKWRTWDLAHVKKSYVMKVIWGVTDASHHQEPNTASGTVYVSIGTLRLSVDPGPKENGLLVQDLSVCIDRSNRTRPDPSPSSTITSISIKTYCSDVALTLKWEICQLIEGVLRTMSAKPPPSDALPQESNGESSPGENLDFQLVFASDRGNIELDAINLKVNLAGEGFKGSIIHHYPDSATSPNLSVLLACDSSLMEFRGRSGTLMLWQLLHPNVFLAHNSKREGSLIQHDWKCSAACKRLRYDMVEDPLGIIDVADRIVEDEIKYILDLSAPSDSPEPQKTAPNDATTHRFCVATFLEDYEIRVSLLPSVSFLVSGRVARLSVAPTADSRIAIDFDVKDNRHTLQSDNDSKKRVISSLVVPPINGRVVVDLFPTQMLLDIDSTIELIELEAGAVRNLLAAINGPEISHFLSDLNHDAEIFWRHLNQVISRSSHSPVAKPAKKTKELLYRLRLTLAGIDIHSSAPGLRNKDYSADLRFNFGLIQVHLENAPESGAVLEYPEFHVNISHVKFGLHRRDKWRAQPYGSLALYARISGVSKINENGESIRSYHLSSNGLEVELFAETASMIIDIAAHLQKRLRSIDLSHEVKNLRERLIPSPEKTRDPSIPKINVPDQIDSKKLFDAMYSLELKNIRLIWLISAPNDPNPDKEAEDLVFSIEKVELATKKDNAARLRIEAMQLQMVPVFEDKTKRSLNSALLPEAVFNVAYLSTNDEHRLAFQTAGKAVDIRITSDFILPASLLQDSLAAASEKLRDANSLWTANVPSGQKKKETKPKIKRLGSLLIDADFAGGVVSLQSRENRRGKAEDVHRAHAKRSNSKGKYGQYIQDAAATARFQAPGVALKVQFEDTGNRDPTLNAELKVDASTNVLYPTVVPLITQISSSVKEVVGENESAKAAEMAKNASEKALYEQDIGVNNPTTILGKCKLNVGLRISRQEFTLSCQPIARVAATARFGDSYITVNTVQSEEKRRFFAVQVAFNALQASIKHVYSSESTASFEIDSIVMSLMNSKHVSSNAGISAILKVSPMKLYGNVKQAQDFLLFREIWVPEDDAASPPKAAPDLTSPETQAFVVQRYRQMATTGAFPWNSALSIEQLNVQLDLGQTVGRSDFTIRNLWVSSKKNSDSEQNLCVGFDSIEIQSKGRLSGFVQLSRVKLRTSIVWTDEADTEPQTPLIQASIGFSQLQAKISFEYQPFLVADVACFDFLMYNVRDPSGGQNDRLVSTLDGDKLQIFCTTLTASQSVALYQTLQRLAQDKQSAYDSSLKEIESFLWRKSTVHGEGARPEGLQKDESGKADDDESKMPISLHTDVMVSLRAINIGAFPSTFDDSQVFKLEARDAEARFSAAAVQERIHGGLGLTLGELRVGLSSVNRPSELTAGELSVGDIADRATDSRGGTILKVPRVIATMETWQSPASSNIDYIFKSSFEGRVDVGWNYSRVSFIRGMWTNHSRALATRLGKRMPQAAVRITGGPKEGEDGEYSGQEKITAVVNVPQSRYSYTALEPPVIETPQLRDMGEATPPLEWIGLHRDKLPNLTHQIIMVTLMEVAKDVEDAYSKILGS